MNYKEYSKNQTSVCLRVKQTTLDALKDEAAKMRAETDYPFEWTDLARKAIDKYAKDMQNEKKQK